MDKLLYTVNLVDYSDESISLEMNFEDPLYVSTGDSPDSIVVSFLDPELFASKKTGKTLAPESSVE